MKFVRLFIALALLTVGMTQLVAAPPFQYWRTYYTDATKTVECGYANVACNFTTYSGCRTVWYDDEIMGECW